MDWEKVTVDESLPMETHGVLSPYAVVVPHSNRHEAAKPSGFTTPDKSAELSVLESASFE